MIPDTWNLLVAQNPLLGRITGNSFAGVNNQFSTAAPTQMGVNVFSPITQPNPLLGSGVTLPPEILESIYGGSPTESAAPTAVGDVTST